MEVEAQNEVERYSPITEGVDTTETSIQIKAEHPQIIGYKKRKKRNFLDIILNL